MMNRNLMNRQMFRDGGAAFPDLSGDGKVTRKDILIGRGVVPMQEGGAAPMPSLSTEDLQLFLQNYPDYLENNSLYDERGVVKPEVMQEVQRLKESNVMYSDPLRPVPSDPLFVPTPSRQPQISPEQLQIFLENNPGYLEEKGSVYGEDGNLNPGVLPPPVGMEEGGMAMAPQGMMPAAPPAEMPEIAQAQQAGMDPAILEQMLSQASQGIMALDEAEDYEQVMNSMRETDATLEERRMELADIVGEQDAQQTPESVLTLVQPVMMMAKTDQGIGGLAQGEMTEPVTGDMAAGIMSTVNMGAEEGPAPVNFNQGGVVGMEKGGDPLLASYKARLPLYEQIAGIDPAVTKQQQDLDKAQMLFALAQGGLQIASPTDRRMSIAEKLALSGQGVLQNISGIAAGSAQRKAQEDAAMRQAKFGALQAAETDLAAQAKAKQDLAIQTLKGAQDIAKMDRQSVLDTTMGATLEGLKQAGRLELKGIEGEQQMSLEELKQSGAITLEDYRQVNRTALEEQKNKNDQTIETLRQSGRQADLVLANELEKENINLRADIKLNEMGVANEYELSKMDKAHEQATELNNTNNALKEKLSDLDREIQDRRLALDTKKAAVAATQGQRKIDLQRELQDMQAEMNEFEKTYKTDKLDIERAAARLDRLGGSTDARITTLISDPESLAKYAAGTMTPEETLEFNQAIAYYNAPKSVWSEEQKQFIIAPGNPLSNELMSSIQIRQESGLTIPNIKLKDTKEGPPSEKQEVTSRIMEGVDDPTSAFGTKAAAKNLFNTLAEIALFGAPYKPEKESIAAVQALNTKFVQVFQRSAELRDSVMQLKLLDDLTAKPANLLMGPEAAGAKVTKILALIEEADEALNIKLNDRGSPLSAKEVTEAKGYITDLKQLRAGYKVIDNAYQLSSNRASKVNMLREDLGLPLQ